MSQTVNDFYIVPPKLSANEKRLYKPVKETSVSLDLDSELTEVIGEDKIDGKLYYYARLGGDPAQKYPAQQFSRIYPNLIDKYRRKKTSGNLESYDPSSSYVHPTSRIKVGSAFASNSTRNRKKTISISGEDDYEDLSGESERESSDYDYQSDGQQRPTTRSSAKHARELPFSPRKSRRRKIYTVTDSDESGSEAQTTLRRSTRSKPAKLSIRLDDYSGASGDDDVQKSNTSRRGARPKVVRQRKPIKPAYGIVHDVSDAEQESDDDLNQLAVLRRHRHVCEKCHERAAHDLLREHERKPKKGRPSRKKDEFEESEDEDARLKSLGGWVRCLKCPVVAHWKCLAPLQRDDILRASREKSSLEQADLNQLPKKRTELEIHESTVFVCGACTKGGICMGCMEATTSNNTDDDADTTTKLDMELEKQPQLLFRCFTCRRPAHYEHLMRPQLLPEDSSVADIAEYYQKDKGWLCADCSSYIYSLDKILAWRPYPPDAVEPPYPPDELPNYKDPLPREYLVKWIGRSYRRIQWVPHMWLLSTNQAKLKNFVNNGSRVELKRGSKRSKPLETADILESLPDINDDAADGLPSLEAFPDADQHIPQAWKTVDRVLDVLFWRPKSNMVTKNNTRIDSDSETIETKVTAEYSAVFANGKEPSAKNTKTVTQWQAREKRQIAPEDIGDVVWVFIKWEDLNYDEATWDSPPQENEQGYDAFVKAFARFIESRQVKIPKYSQSDLKNFENRPKDNYRHHYMLRNPTDLQLGQSPELKLLPFQIDGFNWLCNNWYNRQPCILADEMGLGKTVQIAAFLGNIAAKFEAMPALVVVPNSTITNWVRELERWAPNLRVVPFHGEAKAREVIKKFELHHERPPKGSTQAKFHVLVATYEALLIKADFAPVFKAEPRWEVLVVDEGQRLKNDSSMLFKKLNELNSRHRILMTGTPLNNNIRELFNLMNFLDPGNWDDLDALEKEYEELTEDLVKELHDKLRPYFLRRIKSEVLELPPKNEVIVPVSMAPIQREVYRSILSHNVDILKGLAQTMNTRGTVMKKNVHNILMQLRKCLQHPYLYDENIEPRGLPQKETHEKLIDASAKLRLLKGLLPKLKARGHRVLLFSQFVIALNIVEDYLVGEGYKYLRLDGNIKSSERQKGMDEFNRPGSDVFLYLLTTRAGGVGINLYTADTVIIFDPDFNPHQDLQAISRAYRYGQKKTCLVFKLMVKDSAEERIVQIGKKKLVLDHLIVQKMDDGDSVGEDVQSILTFGAKALFEGDQESRDIIYTDQDIDKLIERTEQEGEEQKEVEESALSFSFAKVWAADKDTLEDVPDDNQGDSWAQTLQKINAERDKMRMQEVAASGRGVRRAAAHKANYYDDGVDGSPPKGKKKSKSKSKSVASDTSSYSESDHQSDEESVKSAAIDVDADFLMINGTAETQPHKSRSNLIQSEQGRGPADTTRLTECGLCGLVHGTGSGECFMTDKSEYLAEYREMLILHSTDEPWEVRSEAIRAIDETLHRRGHLSIIAGQPLHPLRVPTLPVVDTVRQSSSSLKRPAPPAGDSAQKKFKPSTLPYSEG
ncbi:hypothetical protein M378DRAFT_155365 [Amanita muscaria Koide BX008]|uniref:Chromatin remodeling factor mit1 n=1 Tax=Amanita muscaria (strain Koide BX008) TaxID=946122 RepID=A0A0C2T706_AMAMK|nr:hypothetical protein M378DRAFT_155365 [Amanita muscaria Koide BX008]